MPKRQTPARKLKSQVKALSQDVAQLRAELQSTITARLQAEACLSARVSLVQAHRASFDALEESAIEASDGSWRMAGSGEAEFKCGLRAAP